MSCHMRVGLVVRHLSKDKLKPTQKSSVHVGICSPSYLTSPRALGSLSTLRTWSHLSFSSAGRSDPGSFFQLSLHLLGSRVVLLLFLQSPQACSACTLWNGLRSWFELYLTLWLLFNFSHISLGDRDWFISLYFLPRLAQYCSRYSRDNNGFTRIELCGYQGSFVVLKKILTTVLWSRQSM